MSLTPTLGLLPHDVAGLLRQHFEQRAKCHGMTRAGEAPEGVPTADRERLFNILPLTKSNLSRARTRPAGFEETNHG